MLATGNQINAMDSYSNESVAIHGGIRTHSLTGIAIINPASPSREIPFIIPSRQKGREPRRFSVPKGAFIHQVSVQVPKDIFGSMALNAAAYQVGPALDDSRSISLSTSFPPVVVPFAQRMFDSGEVTTRLPGAGCGTYVRYSNLPVYGTEIQEIAVTELGEGFFSNCPIVADNHDYLPNTFPPEYSNKGLQLLTSWTPLMLTKTIAPALLTFSGKKSAVILTVSYQTISTELVSSADLFAGINELG